MSGLISPVNRGSFQMVVATLSARVSADIVEKMESGQDVNYGVVKKMCFESLSEFGLSTESPRDRAVAHSALETLYSGGVI
jgi:hypothetical protein